MLVRFDLTVKEWPQAPAGLVLVVLVRFHLAVTDGLKRRPGWDCAGVRFDLAVKNWPQAPAGLGLCAGSV
ncbi:hypothetical protein ACFVDU_06085 [Streptomyces albidoflavus]